KLSRNLRRRVVRIELAWKIASSLLLIQATEKYCKAFAPNRVSRFRRSLQYLTTCACHKRF
ncbi:PIPO, partial [Tomato necrotic stunt virus]|uniref:PIPO n=1 Tax=Tomato necrotic stunt virus TaxID=1176153 RepID=UPI000265503E